MPTLLASGGMSDLYDLGNGTVVKAYRRQSHTHESDVDWQEHDAITRKLWAIEAEAYQRVTAADPLRSYVPGFHGCVDPQIVIGGAPHPDREYVSGCGLILDRIEGRDLKVSLLPSSQRRAVEAVLEDIRNVAGNVYVWDASCFMPGAQGPFTVIDFGLWGSYAKAQEILAMQGTLSPAHRQMWGLVYDAS